jgi:hypothetical protein
MTACLVKAIPLKNTPVPVQKQAGQAYGGHRAGKTRRREKSVHESKERCIFDAGMYVIEKSKLDSDISNGNYVDFPPDTINSPEVISRLPRVIPCSA